MISSSSDFAMESSVSSGNSLSFCLFTATPPCLAAKKTQRLKQKHFVKYPS
jgi:hypothetical protein